MRYLLAILLLVALSATASAEQIAITGGKVYVSGDTVMDGATVLIKDGKILSVGSTGGVPAGYREIDASGKIVTVGLLVSGTTLGMGEVSSSAGINDASIKGSVKNTIALDVSYALNPDTTLIPVNRIEGITRAVTGFSRTSTAWQGQGAVIHLGNGPDMIIKNPAFISLNVTGSKANQTAGSRAVLWAGVYEKLDSAKPADKPTDKKVEKAGKKSKKSRKSKKDSEDKASAKKPSAEMTALKRLFSGETALLVAAHRAADIRQVIKLKKTYPSIRVILSGGREAWRVASELAAADIGVVISGTANLPGSFETLGSTQTNAAQLHAAGVKIAFIGDGDHRAKLMPQHAGNAVANGLPWAAAFDAMTVNPAEFYGISDSYGTLEAGKDADVVIWSGDPIEITSHAEMVIIAGTQIEMVSRQTKLRDRYMALPRSPAFQR